MNTINNQTADLQHITINNRLKTFYVKNGAFINNQKSNGNFRGLGLLLENFEELEAKNHQNGKNM